MTLPQSYIRDLTLAAAALAACAAVSCVGPKLQETVPKVDVLQVLPASTAFEVGDTANLGALRLRDGKSTNVTADAEWRSDDESF